MEKAREIMQEAKSYGEKISFQNALELSKETGSVKKFITATNLYNSFYANHKILTEDNLQLKESYLYLSKIVLMINEILLDILGISIPDRI